MGQGRSRKAIAPGLLLSGAVVALALPSAVLAFSTSITGIRPQHDAEVAQIAPVPVKARLVSSIALRSLTKDHTFPFTPAGSNTRPDRSVTVAVRVDADTARAITVHGRLSDTPGTTVSPLGIAPTVYSLGISKGYRRFAQTVVPAGDGRGAEMPDLTAYAPATSTPSASGKFAPRIALDEKRAPGSAPRTYAGDGEDTLDVGGSYHLSRNVDVTAGVRYSQERFRLEPLTDGKQDGQAVYVGTQFRF